MKHRKRIEKEIVKLSKKLPKISERQKAWAIKTLTKKYVTFKWKSHYCLECNHKWKDNIEQTKMFGDIICPNCKSKLELIPDFSGYTERNEYFNILTTFKGKQVVRLFYLTSTYRIKREPEHEIKEVMQHWIDTNGNLTSLGRQSTGFSYYDNWGWDPNLEVRTNSQGFISRCNISSDSIYPYQKILPIIKRNGYKGSTDIHYQQLFSIILNNHHAELMLKANQIELLSDYIRRGRNADQFWDSVKLAIRYNYIIDRPNDWYDYLYLLETFGKDLLNPKVILPKDFKKEHNRYVKKRRDILRKKKLKEQIEQLQKDNKIYKKEKKKYFKLKFKQDELIIKPITSVEGFLKEGDELKHCVYTNSYYKDKDSLIFSAKINKEHIETIEVSLIDFTLIQSRGINNVNSQYHNKIVELVKSNINQIKQAS